MSTVTVRIKCLVLEHHAMTTFRTETELLNVKINWHANHLFSFMYLTIHSCITDLNKLNKSMIYLLKMSYLCYTCIWDDRWEMQGYCTSCHSSCMQSFHRYLLQQKEEIEITDGTWEALCKITCRQSSLPNIRLSKCWIMCNKGIHVRVSIDTLDRHSLDISIDTWSMLDQHLGWQSVESRLIFADMPSIVNRYVWVGWHSANYQPTVDWVSI